MTAQINSRIVGYRVKADEAPPVPAMGEELPRGIHEAVPRPQVLVGSTYKIKPADQEHAAYVTINDIYIDGQPHPFEVFINSKNMEHFQWITALTRVISAVFRKGGDVAFLVDELKAVFDPRGGYFKKGGGFMPSLVAEIGYVIEKHLTSIGLLAPEIDPHMQAFIVEKKAQAEDSIDALSNAMRCTKCHEHTVVKMDGCLTCLNCGDSKCG